MVPKGDFEGELPAFFVEPHELEAFPRHGPPSTRKVPLDGRMVPGAEALGQEHRELVPEEFFLRISEDPFDRPVHVLDSALVVHRDDAVPHGRGDRPEAVLASSGCGLRSRPFLDGPAQDLTIPQEGAQGGGDRGDEGDREEPLDVRPGGTLRRDGDRKYEEREEDGEGRDENPYGCGATRQPAEDSMSHAPLLVSSSPRGSRIGLSHVRLQRGVPASSASTPAVSLRVARGISAPTDIRVLIDSLQMCSPDSVPWRERVRP